MFSEKEKVKQTNDINQQETIRSSTIKKLDLGSGGQTKQYLKNMFPQSQLFCCHEKPD